MACPFETLADKIDLHRKIDGSPGYHLSALEVETIVRALRYTAGCKAAIEAADSDNQQLKETP